MLHQLQFPANWDDVDFRQAVYDNIIKPVEDLVSAWTLEVGLDSLLGPGVFLVR